MAICPCLLARNRFPGPHRWCRKSPRLHYAATHRHSRRLRDNPLSPSLRKWRRKACQDPGPSVSTFTGRGRLRAPCGRPAANHDLPTVTPTHPVFSQQNAFRNLEPQQRRTARAPDPRSDSSRLVFFSSRATGGYDRYTYVPKSQSFLSLLLCALNVISATRRLEVRRSPLAASTSNELHQQTAALTRPPHTENPECPRLQPWRRLPCPVSCRRRRSRRRHVAAAWISSGRSAGSFHRRTGSRR